MCAVTIISFGKLDLEGRVRQHFDYHAFKLYNVILWQNNPSLIIFKRYF